MGRALIGFVALLGLVAVLVTPASAPVYLGHATSGSMAPAIDAGDGYVIVSPGEVETGDVVVFRSPDRGGLVTHRVVERVDDGFLTKGDANAETDQATGMAPVPRSAIEGEVLSIGGSPLVVPGLGTFVHTLRTHWLLAIGLVVAAGVLVGIRDRQRRDPRERTLLRVGHVVPPLLAGLLVLGVVVVLLASSSHAVVLDGAGVGGGTATVSLHADRGPLTHVVVGAEGATIEERTVEGDAMDVTLSVAEASDGGGQRLVVYPYPRTLPAPAIESLHAVHPALAAFSVVSAILGPLGLVYALAIDGRQPLRRPLRRRGGT